MELKNSFEVLSAPEQVWDFLLRMEDVVPCMPGAELTQVIDDRNWKGRVNVKLGPVSLTYAGTVSLQERDDDNRRVVLKAQGTEARGKGMASAVVISSLKAVNGSTQVDIITRLTISGAAAQFGRGMLGDVSQRFTDDFAKAMSTRLGQSQETSSHPAPEAPKPISGLRLGLWALWRAVVRVLKWPFRPSSSRTTQSTVKGSTP